MGAVASCIRFAREARGIKKGDKVDKLHAKHAKRKCIVFFGLVPSVLAPHVVAHLPRHTRRRHSQRAAGHTSLEKIYPRVEFF